jgi:hypothetical protein
MFEVGVAMERALTDSVQPYAAVTVLAEALDRLGARIHRDLHVESREAAPVSDPDLARTLVKFSAYADECLEVLEDARVLAALTAAKQIAVRPDVGTPHGVMGDRSGT